MKIKLIVCYDGTNFCGWQIQKNGVSVQETIENAIFSLTGERVKVTGSGRTDAGVHALGQVADFDTISSIPPEKFAFALNPILPDSVKILKSERASDGFNARKSAKRKTYVYSLYSSLVENPLKERYATRIEGDLDLEEMKSACKIIKGKHDFKCMCSTGSGATTTVRTIYSISVKRLGDDVKITVTGNGFLYNMVRIIAGTLVGVGQGKISLEAIKEALERGERHLLGRTLSAKGLCLQSVKY